MNKYVIEYTLDNPDNDCDYITDLCSIMDVNKAVNKLKQIFGKRIVKLDYKQFNEIELIKHVTVI